MEEEPEGAQTGESAVTPQLMSRDERRGELQGQSLEPRETRRVAEAVKRGVALLQQDELQLPEQRRMRIVHGDPIADVAEPAKHRRTESHALEVSAAVHLQFPEPRVRHAQPGDPVAAQDEKVPQRAAPVEQALELPVGGWDELQLDNRRWLLECLWVLASV